MNTLPPGTKVKEYKPNGKDSVIAVLEPSNAYGKFLEDILIPEGYEKVGFDVPSADGKFIEASVDGAVGDFRECFPCGGYRERIIVRPIEKIKKMVYFNFYDDGSFTAYASENSARDLLRFSSTAVAVAVPVTVEYYKGQGK